MIPAEFKTTKSIYDTYSRIIHDITRGWDFDDSRFDEYEFENIINPVTKNSYGYAR
jgi:hypothetical protein